MTGPEEQPWWHQPPDTPPVDSVFTEGMRLAAALRDWAVDSGAVAMASQMLGQAASALQPGPGAGAHEPTRCQDCPVCQGLNALEAVQPDLAASARENLAGLTALVQMFLAGAAGAGDDSDESEDPWWDDESGAEEQPDENGPADEANTD